MLKNILKVGKLLPTSTLKTINGGRKSIAAGCPQEKPCPLGESYSPLMCCCEPDEPTGGDI